MTALIILQYGNYEATIECIKSIEKYNTTLIKYIVVDNCSPDGVSADRVAEFVAGEYGAEPLVLPEGDTSYPVLPRFTIVKSEMNDGYARGNNKGIMIAFRDISVNRIMILNNDILFVDDIIPKLKEDLKTLPDCALVSPLLYKPDMESIDPNCARYEGRIRDTLIYNFALLHVTKSVARATYMPIEPNTGLVPVELISGSCIMVDKEFFRSINAFDPGTFLYQEENILWEKIKRAGRVNYVDTDIRCIHLGASTIGKGVHLWMLKGAFRSQRYFIRHYVDRYRYLKLGLVTLSHWWVLGAVRLRNLFRR